MESQVWVQNFGTSAVILPSMSEGPVGEGLEHTCSPKCLPHAVLLPGRERWEEVPGTLCLCDPNPSPRLHQQFPTDANANRNKCGEAEGGAAGGNLCQGI